MSALLLVLSAFGAPPLDAEALADAEIDANARIEACRYSRCAADARELAEAFLIRATAAAVLRGEIDATSAANARHLAPDLALGWGSLLPDSDRGAPDDWVRTWTETLPPRVLVRPVVEPAPVAVRAPPAPPRPPPAPGRPPPDPLELTADAPAVARVGLSVVPGGNRQVLLLQEGHLEADLRVQLAAPVALLAAGTLGASQSRWNVPEITDVQRLSGRSGSLRLGAGPRWTDGAGGEVFVYGALVAETSAVTWGTWAALAEDDVYGDPGTRGLGGAVGVIGVQPLSPRVALHAQGSAEHVKRRAGARYTDGRREEAFTGFEPLDPRERDALARDHETLRLALAAQWRAAAASALTLYAGAELRVESSTGPRPDGMPAPGFDPHVDLAPRLGAAFAF